jgi:hypothetical protein
MSSNAPSANFTCAFFTTIYSPTDGITTTPSQLVTHWLVYLQSLFTATLPFLYTLVFSTLTYHLTTTRLAALEAASIPLPPPVDHTKSLLDVLRNTIKALTLTQNDVLDIFTKLSAIPSDLDAIGIDIHNLGARIHLVSKTLVGLENNVETTRILLGAGVADDEDDGLTIGDEMEVFWVEGDEMEEEVEEVIDVEASDDLVARWLGRCAWPEECYDA